MKFYSVTIKDLKTKKTERVLFSSRPEDFGFKIWKLASQIFNTDEIDYTIDLVI